MDRNGKKQEITSIPFNSEQQMVIQIGDSSNFEFRRIDVGTSIEYLSNSDWIEGVVNSYNSILVNSEVVELQANTNIRLKNEQSVVGFLVFNNSLDIEYNADDLQELLRFQFGSGFSNYLFGRIEATGGLQITMQSGFAVIDGIVVFFSTPQNINIDAGVSFVRKDLLVLRKSQADKMVYLAIKKGVASSSPQVPSLIQNIGGVYELPILEITVQPNSQSITSRDIKDVRPRLSNSQYPVIFPYYTQYAKSDGTFNENEAPNNWLKKMYNIDTTWELIFNTDSVTFITEGQYSNDGRSNGVQGDAIREITGYVGLVGSNNAGYFSSISPGVLNPTTYDNTAYIQSYASTYVYHAIDMKVSRQVPTASVNRMRNRLIRVYRLLSINGVNVGDIIGG